MKLRVPDYFDDFSCLAGACPHSCCMEWEVVLDEDTAGGTAPSPARWGSGSAPRCSLTERTGAFRFAAGAAPF